MISVKSFLEDLMRNSGVIFSLIGIDGTLYIDGGVLNKKSVASIDIVLGKNRAVLSVEIKNQACLSLLKYTIENKYGEILTESEKCLIDVIEGHEVPQDLISRYFSFLEEGTTLFIVKIYGSRNEGLSIVRDIFSAMNSVSTLYKDNILILAAVNEGYMEAEKIRDVVTSSLYSRCSIGYAEGINNFSHIYNAYEVSKDALMLGERYKVRGNIYNYSNMLLEKVVYNINLDLKNEILGVFNHKFKFFDDEIISTIEEFASSGLNVSDTAKKLYIHRNTLIYRLDKIFKETGYDLRNFKQATIFMMAFLLWKEDAVNKNYL